MLQVSSFIARSFDLDHVDLWWELSDYDENILGYDFKILRSESPAGPWQELTPSFQDQYHFRDTSPALLHKWRTIYYLLRVTHRDTGNTKDFGPTAQMAEPDLIALEILRQEDMLFREFIGRRCWLFPVRTFGAKCVCYDKLTQRRTRSNCLTCFDTGYLGGYLSPIECWLQFDPDARNPQLTPFGEQQNRNTSARLISFPPIKPKDILVEAENRRWKVVTVSGTERLRARLHQELTLHEIPKGDVEYKLPINIENLASLSIAAERNFTNPQNPEKELHERDLVALYGPRGTPR